MKTITLTKRLLMLTLVIGILGVTSCSDDEPSVDPPNAAFTSAADGLTVTFTDGSVGADTYSWDFGDGNSSTEASPTHTYAAGGTYTVSLTVTNAGGSSTDSEELMVSSGINEAVLGTWRVANEDGSLAVGPSAGSAEWWSLAGDDLAGRTCLTDDDYIFAADGSFTVDMGDASWVERWQSDEVTADACGTPLAPFTSGAFTFTASDTELTLNGEGAFVGLAKVVNAGELGDPDGNRTSVEIPTSVTYQIAEVTSDRMTLQIEAGSGVHWTFVLTKVQ